MFHVTWIDVRVYEHMSTMSPFTLNLPLTYMNKLKGADMNEASGKLDDS